MIDTIIVSGGNIHSDFSSARSNSASATDILPHSVEFRVMGVQMLRDGLHEQEVI